MDNFHIDITSEGFESLKKAMSILDRKNRKVTGYLVDDKAGLVLFDGDSDLATKLPFPMSIEKAADFVNQWLESTDYGPQPEHDGCNRKGFRLYCDDYGYVMNEYRAFVAIKPEWAWYGK